jgi:hypothetical protein
MNPFQSHPTYSKRSHIIPAACPRHPSTVIFADAQLRLAVNEYTSYVGSRAGITMLLTHGTSFNKDFWDIILQQWLRPDSPLSLARILALDAVNHGDSATLNAHLLTSTSESSRDPFSPGKMVPSDVFQPLTSLIRRSADTSISLLA